jgi:hypothetical protein
VPPQVQYMVIELGGRRVASSSEKPIHLVPANLASFVLFFEPAH